MVDPGDEAPVHTALVSDGLRLASILVTHHHPDHVGGVAALAAAHSAPVWGPAREHVPAPFTPVAEGDAVELLGLRFEVIEVPGHTAGHVAYYAGAGLDAPLLFCGDTLFSGGCGRLFEGTPAQMHASLQRLAALPDATQVCCAHEYTLANLRFATAVEPGNAALAAYLEACQARRAAGAPLTEEEAEYRDDLTGPAVAALCSRLPEEERTLFVLRYFSGYNSVELGDMFGLSPSAVRARLLSARRKLGKMYLEE